MKRTTFLILLGTLALAACDDSSISLQGNGERVTETRSVSDFDAVKANNGVQVFLTGDPSVTGDVVLEVTTDSNIQEFLTTKVSGNKLTVNSTRLGGVTPTQGFDVSGTVAVLDDVSADNGAQVEITGTADHVTLAVNNGARLEAGAFEAATVEVDADNGAQITVCATEKVSGEVTNGADLTVLCGGSMSVDSSDGGRVSSSP